VHVLAIEGPADRQSRRLVAAKSDSVGSRESPAELVSADQRRPPWRRRTTLPRRACRGRVTLRGGGF